MPLEEGSDVAVVDPAPAAEEEEESIRFSNSTAREKREKKGFKT